MLKRFAVACLLSLTVALTAMGYRQPPPPHVPVEVTWIDSTTGKETTAHFRMVFDRVPIKESRRGIDIKSTVPSKDGEIWIAHKAGDTFIFHDYHGDHEFQFGIDDIPFILTSEGELDKAMNTSMKEADSGAKLDEHVVADLEEDLHGEADADDADEEVDARKKGDSNGPTGPPVAFAATEKMPAPSVKVTAIRKISFNVPRGYKRETPRGRFVQYSNAAKGSGGQVQVLAATFFGGEADDGFQEGAFLPDGSIIAAGSFHDLSFAKGPATTVIGKDPAADAYPMPQPPEPKPRRWRQPPHPRLTPAVVHYTADLKQVKHITRLPWAAGRLDRLQVSPKGSVYISGDVTHTFDAVLAAATSTQTIENTEAVAYAKKKGREPRGDSFIARLSADLKSLEWVVVFKHDNIDFGIRHDETLVVQRGRYAFFEVSPDGKVGEATGLSAQIGGRAFAPLAVSPIDGSLYLGGEYHSGTGREPWRCPFMHKFDSDGEIEWTAWNWTGPIVGVDQFRLVSDSAVRRIKVGADNSVIVIGWSDGGNSVFTRQPYDLGRSGGDNGFGGSIWGAGVLSVAYFIRLQDDIPHQTGYTRWLSYLPMDDLPNSASVRDFGGLPDGRIYFTGGSAYGLIETHDAWIPAWHEQVKTNPYARAKGGPYFAMFSYDFQKLLFSSQAPGLKHKRVTSQNNKILLVGSAAEIETAYDANQPTIIKHAQQKTFGGGSTDGYVMLIDAGPSPVETQKQSRGHTADPRSRTEKAVTAGKAFLATVPDDVGGRHKELADAMNGVWDFAKEPHSYPVLLVLRQDDTVYPGYFVGGNKSGKLTIQATDDVLSGELNLKPSGTVRMQLTRAPRKQGMEDDIPGGVWAEGLSDRDFYVQLSEYRNPTLATRDKKENRQPRQFTMDVSGIIHIDGKKTDFDGKATLTFSDETPTFAMKLTFSFEGAKLGLGGDRGKQINATLHTSMAPTRTRPPKAIEGDLDFEF